MLHDYRQSLSNNRPFNECFKLQPNPYLWPHFKIVMPAAGLQLFTLMTHHKIATESSILSPLHPTPLEAAAFGPPPHMPIMTHTYIRKLSGPHVIEGGQAICSQAPLQPNVATILSCQQTGGDKLMATKQSASFCCFWEVCAVLQKVLKATESFCNTVCNLLRQQAKQFVPVWQWHKWSCYFVLPTNR